MYTQIKYEQTSFNDNISYANKALIIIGYKRTKLCRPTAKPETQALRQNARSERTKKNYFHIGTPQDKKIVTCMIALSSVPIVRLAIIGNTAISSSDIGSLLPRTNVSTISRLPYINTIQ